MFLGVDSLREGQTCGLEEVSLVEDSIFEVDHPFEVSPSEVSMDEVSLVEVSPSEVSPLKVSPSKVSIGEFSPLKVSPWKVSPSEVSPFEISTEEVSIGEVQPRQVSVFCGDTFKAKDMIEPLSMRPNSFRVMLFPRGRSVLPSFSRTVSSDLCSDISCAVSSAGHRKLLSVYQSIS